MTKTRKANGLLVALAMVALAAGLVIQQRGEAMFGADTDLFSGVAVGVAVGLLLIVVLTAVVKVPPER